MADITYVVTVPSGTGGGYYIDGVQKATLNLTKGVTYRFDQSNANNATHPFKFSTTADGIFGGGSEYTTGVTVVGTAGNPGAYVEIELTYDSPSTLYYYCGNHLGMGGQLNIAESPFLFSVTVVNTPSGNKYVVNGVQQATLNFAKGATYRFEQSDPTNTTHPINFSTTSDGTFGGGTEYTTGVTKVGTAGSAGAYIEIETSSSTPDTLYYYCLNHAGMGGQIDLSAISYGALSWNLNSWGQQDSVNIEISGFSLSTQISGAVVFGSQGWGGQFWNSGEWGDLQSPEAPVTGISLSANIGSVTATGIINTGWGHQEWNAGVWGIAGNQVDLTGIQLSSDLGNILTTADANIIPTGEELNTNLGTLDAFSLVEVDITGLSMIGEINFNPAIVDAVGFDLSSSLGTAESDANTIASITTEVNPGWGASVGWGQQEWGQASVQMSMSMDEGTVDPSPDASIVGIGFSASLAIGTVVIGNANVTVIGEGFGASLGIGELDAVTFAAVDGISISANLGTIAKVTGNAKVFPIGLNLTTSLGTNKTLIWNQVDTGTAPVDPPGWVEIAA